MLVVTGWQHFRGVCGGGDGINRDDSNYDDCGCDPAGAAGDVNSCGCSSGVVVVK